MDKNLKIGVIGLGLIGGSIFKALCALKYDVFAATRSESTIEKAKQYSPNVSRDTAILKDCDVVFVCTHMNKTEGVLAQLAMILQPTAIVTDVCSLKRFISKRTYNFKFIPSHPMAGTEFNGFEYSLEDLFEKAKWVVTPPENTADADINKLTDIIKDLKAEPIITSPNEHDEAVALVSHMPMLIAQALFKTAQENDLALKLASSGFRDMTRLALSNEEMANDMVHLNSDNIQNVLLKLYSCVGELLDKDYLEQIKELKTKRQSMYVDGKNIL